MSSSGGGQPRTVDVRLQGPAVTQTFTLPPGVTFDVEAVYIEVDTTGAGGVVTAELTISEQSGVVIAKKTQGSTIPAGGSGTATWALRLTDDAGGGGGNDPHAVHYDVPGETGGFIDSTTTTGGISFEDHSGSGLTIESEDPGGVTGGFISITTADGETFIASTSIVDRLSPAGGAFEIQDNSGNDVVRVDENRYITNRLGSGTVFAILGPFSALIARFTEGAGGANVYEMKLPTVNPGGTNRLWNNGGVVNIT